MGGDGSKEGKVSCKLLLTHLSKQSKMKSVCNYCFNDFQNFNKNIFFKQSNIFNSLFLKINIEGGASYDQGYSIFGSIRYSPWGIQFLIFIGTSCPGLTSSLAHERRSPSTRDSSACSHQCKPEPCCWLASWIRASLCVRDWFLLLKRSWFGT